MEIGHKDYVRLQTCNLYYGRCKKAADNFFDGSTGWIIRVVCNPSQDVISPNGKKHFRDCRNKRNNSLRFFCNSYLFPSAIHKINRVGIDILRKKGIAAAEKKSGRSTSDGLIHSYIHAGGRLGVLVEVNCETDFVARTEDFQTFVHDLAMHIAAAEPRYVSKDDVTEEDLARERDIYIEQAKAEGKPDNIAEKIVDGRMKKFYSQVCLLEQPYVKDQDKTVGTMLKEAVAKFGENMRIARFVRFKLGETADN